MKKIMVALSGGVDSAAAALLLRQQGYSVGGCTLLLRDGGEAEAEDARQTAQTLGIPFTLLDLRAEFRRDVIDYFTATYRAGGTPNPCVVCNRTIKFGRLLDYALAQGYDGMATGHYLRLLHENGRYIPATAEFAEKDQTYVLCELTQEQLAHCVFPLGEVKSKDAVRALAAQAGLRIAKKHDSQDICFIPDGDYVQFLRQHGAELTPGDFVDKDGRVLGRHKGLPCYTSGQRKGLGVAAGKHVYVVRKNGADNTILLGDDADLFSSVLTASRVNWIAGEAPAAPVRCTAKTRYSQHIDAPCTAYPLAGEGVRVVFDTPQRAITAGQSVVLYDGDEVLGGGVIDGAE
mgnify:CR=1 FL=1